MSTAEIILVIVSFISLAIIAWLYNQKSVAAIKHKSELDNAQVKHSSELNVAEIRHESEMKELEELFNNRTEEAKETVEEYETYLIAYKKYYEQLSDIIRVSNERIRQVDLKGAFKADDEIGWFFITIKDIQDTLNEFDFSKHIVKSIPPEPPKKVEEIFIDEAKVAEILKNSK